MKDKLRQYLRNDSCEADPIMEEHLLDDSRSEEIDALLQEVWNKETAPISHIDKTVILNNIKSKANNNAKTDYFDYTQKSSKTISKSLIIKRTILSAAAVLIGVVLTTLWINFSQDTQDQTAISIAQNSTEEVETMKIVAPEPEKLAIVNKPEPIEVKPRKVNINVPEGETHELRFKCDSKVKIEGGSNMIYDENFTGDTRHVSLDGRAHFSITKHEKPFIVDNININLKVLGTEFYIDNRTDMDVINVRVFKGHVMITTPTGTKMDLYEGDDMVIVSRKPNES